MVSMLASSRLRALILLAVATCVVAGPDGSEITSFGVNGSGCPDGSVGSIDHDGDSVTVEFNSFTAKAGSGSSPSQSRRNCQATFTVKVPWGKQFTVGSTEWQSASVRLDNRVTATRSNLFYFQGEVQNGDTSDNLAGPLNRDDFHSLDDFNADIWSPCGQDVVVNVNTAVRVNNANNRGGGGEFSIRKLRVGGLVWRDCNSVAGSAVGDL